MNKTDNQHCVQVVTLSGASYLQLQEAGDKNPKYKLIVSLLEPDSPKKTSKKKYTQKNDNLKAFCRFLCTTSFGCT